MLLVGKCVLYIILYLYSMVKHNNRFAVSFRILYLGRRRKKTPVYPLSIVREYNFSGCSVKTGFSIVAYDLEFEPSKKTACGIRRFRAA